MDVALVAVLSVVGGIFTLKEEQRAALKAFSLDNVVSFYD